jgi:quinol monooxygenase YgiN
MGLAVASARAQTPAAPPPVPDGPRYVVTYIEVAPSATVAAIRLVREFRDKTREETGNLRSEALQRFGRMNQFVVLTVWKDQAAVDSHAKAAATTRFVADIKKVQIAPIDERTHFPLSVGPVENKAGGSLAVVTHVDVIPPQRENGTGIVKQLAERSRQKDGNLRFDAVTQTNRQNHFTVIELWRDRKAVAAHIAAGHTRAFREKLAPATGALHDERRYRLLP